jgi:hypothetical protein
MRRPLDTTPGPTEPHGPRRCGGPEHSVGLSKGSNSFGADFAPRARSHKPQVPLASEANGTGTEINVKRQHKLTGFGVSVKRYG